MPDTRPQMRSERRILAVVRHPLGGVRTHILYTYPYLMEAGYRFTFVIPEGPSHAAFRDDVAAWQRVEVIDVPCRERDRFRAKFRPTVRALLKQRRFALIHSHGMGAAIPTIMANLGVGLPHVMTSHDVFCHAEISGIAGWLKSRALGQMLRRLDALIAVGADARDDHLAHLPALRKGPCRFVSIPNGIDVSRYEPRPPTGKLRGELRLAPNVSLLGFLGRFMPQKGFLILIDALTTLARRPCARPFHLLATGSGDFVREYKAEVARRSELDGRITFREHVSDVAPILRELDLLVIPSLWEACPILPMEALVSGVPVLGSDCIGLREVLAGSAASMVPTNDPLALADAIEQALESPRKDAAVEGVAAARRRFDVRQRATELLALLDSCMHPKAEPTAAATPLLHGKESS